MAKNKGRDNQDKDKKTNIPADNDKPLYEGDLNFATESSLGPGAAARGKDDDSKSEDENPPEIEDVARTWVPSATPTHQSPDATSAEPESDDTEQTDKTDLSKTWVPSNTPTVDGSQHDQESSKPDVPDMGDTWVPHTSSAPDRSAPEPAKEKIDTDKTWVPHDTPTHDGMTDPPAESNQLNLGDTWVPTKDHVSPDTSGPKDDAESETDSETPDVDKTWVPTGTPTHHDFSFDKSDESTFADEVEDDPNKTWMPSDTPTVHGLSPDDSDDEVDFNKTVVGERAEKHSESGTDTEVIPHNEDASTSDSAVMETMVGPVDTGMDATQIFSKTMGMRGLTEEEYAEWQEDIAQKSKSDTDVVEQPEDPAGDSTAGRRTQIWSVESRDGLGSSLTIRSCPVGGVESFENSLLSDKPEYQIIEKLAEGGMGAIYVANQTSLNRELAIKTLKPLKPHEIKSFTNQGRISQVQKQRREMFLSEAYVTAKLIHPHIIPIHDLCQTAGDAPFYSMKRVNGTPWNELIAGMTQEENLEVLHKVCDAMAYAHHNGVVNRDLKPENIMLGEFGEVLVLDWGLAVPATAADKKQFASPSAAFGAGTPAYMSPELWAGPADAIGPWSDIYLLGAILYEAITGKSPHVFPEPDSKTGNSGLWMVIDKVVRKNEIRKTELTGELMDIAMKAMATDPKERHRTVLEFQDAIKSFEKHEESRHLSNRATETLNQAKEHGQKRGYQDYQTAAALFEEAHIGWPENNRARNGLRETRLGYATLAHENGDFDLGLQVAAQEDGEDFVELTRKLTRSRRIRNGLKKATITAAGIIIVVGAISFVQAIKIAQQRNEIIAAQGTAAEATARAKSEEIRAENARKDAVIALAAAQSAKDEAKTALDEAKLAAIEADKAKAEAQEAEQKAIVAMKEADTAKAETLAANMAKRAANMAAEEAKIAADKAAVKAQEATLLAQKATNDARNAQKLEAIAKAEVEKANIAKVRINIELENSKIGSLIRSGSFDMALRGVEDLLAVFSRFDIDGNERPQVDQVAINTVSDIDPSILTKEERKQRIEELTRQKEQLEKRSTATESSVQVQAIGPSGEIVIWGDAQGIISIRKLHPTSDEVSKIAEATLNVGASVSSIAISHDEQLVAATSANTLHLWNPATDQHESVTVGNGQLTTVRLAETYVLVADDEGLIRSIDLATRKERWSIRSSAGIRDLALLRTSRIFLYAGSRGGESADILAYEIPAESNPTARPKRLGQLRLPRDASDPPRRLALSPDENVLLISNSRNGDVLVLPRRANGKRNGIDNFPFEHAADLAKSGESNWVLRHHQRPVNDIAFSQDGSRIATASDDRSIGVWKLSDGTYQFSERLEGHGARVNAAGFLDRSGETLLSAGSDRFCRVWDLEDYDRSRRQLGEIFHLDLSDVRTPGENSHAQRRDVRKDEFRPRRSRWMMARLRLDSGSRSEVETVPVVDDGPEYLVINANQQKQRGALTAAVLSSDGTQLITGAADGTAVIWDTNGGVPVSDFSTQSRSKADIGKFREGHDFNVSRLRFLPPDGRTLLTTGFDGNLCLWDANRKKNSGAGRQEVRIPGLGLVNAVAVSSNGIQIATSIASEKDQQPGSASIWNTSDLLDDSSPKPTVDLSGFHKAEVSALQFSADGSKIATGARDGRVAVWQAESGTRIAGSQVHAKNTIVSHLEWMPDGRLLSAGFDGRLTILSLDESDSAQLKIAGHFQHDRIPVERVAFHPNGNQFVSISVRTDKATQTTAYELELWSCDISTPIRRIHPAIVGGRQPKHIVAAHWSPDGKRLAAVVDGKLHVFSTSSWKVERVLEAPGLGISDAVFAPSLKTTADAENANVLATFDGTAAHMWNLNDGSHMADFRPLFAVQSVAFCECESSPLVMTGDRAVRIFQADVTPAPSDDPFGRTLFKISDPHRGVVSTLAFSPNQTTPRFVSAGADGSAALWKWDRKKRQAIHDSWLCREGAAIAQAAWSPDGNNVLLAAKDGHVRMINVKEAAKTVFDFRTTEDEDVVLLGAAFSSDGRFFAVAGQLAVSGQSTGWVFERIEGERPELHCTISGHEAGGISCLKFIPDSTYLVTGGEDGAAIIWNWQKHRFGEGTLAAYEAYQLLQQGDVVAHRAPVNALSISANGRIATASDDGTAILWRNPFTR